MILVSYFPVSSAMDDLLILTGIVPIYDLTGMDPTSEEAWKSWTASPLWTNWESEDYHEIPIGTWTCVFYSVNTYVRGVKKGRDGDNQVPHTGQGLNKDIGLSLNLLAIGVLKEITTPDGSDASE